MGSALPPRPRETVPRWQLGLLPPEDHVCLEAKASCCPAGVGGQAAESELPYLSVVPLSQFSTWWLETSLTACQSFHKMFLTVSACFPRFVMRGAGGGE